MSINTEHTNYATDGSAIIRPPADADADWLRGIAVGTTVLIADGFDPEFEDAVTRTSRGWVLDGKPISEDGVAQMLEDSRGLDDEGEG